jgi:hypothetical protein
VLGVEDRLDQALPIAKVHEDHPSVIPPSVNPPHDPHFLSDIRLGDLGTVVGSLKIKERVQLSHGVVARRRFMLREK